MITCEQCGTTNGFRKSGNSWVCEDCKIGEVKTTLMNSGGKVTIVREKKTGHEFEGEPISIIEQ
jgi:ribosomal protein L37AE/L43A